MKIQQQRGQEPKSKMWINLPLSIREKLIEIAFSERKSISLVIRELLEEALERRARGAEAPRGGAE